MTTTDQVLDKPWSNIGPGDFVRWRTPRFIKYGRVLRAKDRSLRVQFIEDANPTAIPDAKWYHAQWVLHRDVAEESLCVVDYHDWYEAPKVDPFIPSVDDAHVVWISVSEAAEFMNWDEKKLRRYIRRGHVTAHKTDGRWVVNRDRLRDASSKHGWL